MYEKTRAIVLHLTRHTDRLSILHLYTERLGRVDCLVSNPHVRRSAVRSAMLEPLSILHAEIDQRSESRPQRLVSASMAYVPRLIPTDMTRQCVAMFVSEVLYRSLRRPLADEELFAFLADTVLQLDTAPSAANLHPVFLMQLSRHLGFMPDMSAAGDFFDMQEGVRRSVRPLHPHYVEQPLTDLIVRLAQTTYADMDRLRLNRSARQLLLRKLEEYYRLHVADFYGTQSLDVLESLFD